MSRLLPIPVQVFSVGRELTEAQNRLRRFFGNEFSFDTFPFTEAVGWAPKVGIVETDAELLLTAELPGMVKEDIEITFEDEFLTIQGEKKEEKEEKEEQAETNGVRYHLWERTYGAFRRTFTLPQTVDPAKIIAEMKNGVLKIHMPKMPVTKIAGRRIEIATK